MGLQQSLQCTPECGAVVADVRRPRGDAPAASLESDRSCALGLQAEDRLRLLIYDTADPGVWSLKLEPVDAPPTVTVSPDVDAAVNTALRDRTDLQRARKDIETAFTNTRFAGNTRLPARCGSPAGASPSGPSCSCGWRAARSARMRPTN